MTSNEAMLNRIAVILVPKQPYIDWAVSVGVDKAKLAPETYKPTVFLVSDDIAGDGFGDWEKDGFKAVFKREMQEWHADESTWPELTEENFNKWFLISRMDIVEDMVGDKLLIDDKNNQDGVSGGRN